jgi:hypothetical protein
MNTRLATAYAMLRQAAAQAMTALLNQYGRQYAATPTPQEREKIQRAIMSDRTLWTEMNATLVRKLQRRYPTLRPDDAEDIASQGLLDFLRGQGVQRSLEKYDPNRIGQNGSAVTFAWWMFGRLWQYTGKVAEKFFEESSTGVTKRPGETLLPHAMPSLDAPVTPNAKYQSDETYPDRTPDLGSYRTAPDPITEYKGLLEKVEETLAQMEASPARRTNEGAEQIARLREMQEELSARLTETERSESRWDGPAKAPQGHFSYPARAEAIIPDLPVNKDGRRPTKLTDTGTLDQRLRAYGEQYEGLPQFIEGIMDTRNNVGKALGAKHPTDPNRWYFPGAVYNDSAAMTQDPEVQRKIRQAVIGAFTDAHMILNNKDFHRAHVLDAEQLGSGKLVGTRLKEWLPALIKKRMAAMGLPPELQQSVAAGVANRDLRNLQMLVNDGDEMRRLHTYDRMRQEMGAGDWSQLTPEQREAIVENTYGAMGYGPEQRPFARNPKIRALFNAQAAKDYDPNAMRAYMMSEMQGFGTPRFRATMPQTAQFFNSRGKAAPTSPNDEFQLVADPITAEGKALAIRVAYRIALRSLAEDTLRIATTLESVGCLREAEALDGMVRTAANVLSR